MTPSGSRPRVPVRWHRPVVIGLVVALALALATASAAVARIDFFGGPSRFVAYAPYTAGPVVNDTPHAPHVPSPHQPEEIAPVARAYNPYAPYTPGPVVNDTPHAPHVPSPH